MSVVEALRRVIFVMCPDAGWPTPDHPRCAEIVNRIIEVYEFAPPADGKVRQSAAWLRELAQKGGKGVVGNIDARSLGRIADMLERLSREAAEARNAALKEAAPHEATTKAAIERHRERARLAKRGGPT